MHQTELWPEVAALIEKRRGRAHVQESFDPARTALVVIDMQAAFLTPGLPSEVPAARGIVPAINRLTGAMRAAGGTVAWAYMTFDPDIFTEWSSYFGGICSVDAARRIAEQLFDGAEGHALWHELERAADDLYVPKRRFSAFLPESSDLGERLRDREIDTVIVAGTLTNVCCETSARDAMMQNFNAVMVSDANATYSDAMHNASINNSAIAFADIMTEAEVRAALSRGAHAAA